ncbi:MAG: CPBP family intramembrane metalloprotease [Gorillibacterium sp.]|nr:CPBP family intramembrane metalloprotease [Gorillibacterium sp.]
MQQNIKSIFEIIGKFLLSLVIMLGIAIVLLIPFVIANGLDALTEVSAPTTLAGLIQMITQPIAFLIAIWLMLLMFEKNRSWKLGFVDKRAGRNLIYGMLMGAALMSLGFLLIWLTGGLNPVRIVWNGNLVESLVLWFVFFIFVSLNEETVARGYLQGLFKARIGFLAAIIGSSIVFAALHLGNPGVFSSPIPLANLFLAGVLMALAREKTGSLWYPMGIHLTWNFFQGNLFGFAVSGKDTPTLIEIETHGPSWLTGGVFGAEGSLFGLLVLVGGIAYFVFLYRKRMSTAEQEGKKASIASVNHPFN